MHWLIKVQSYLYKFKAPAISLLNFLTLWRKSKNKMNKLFDIWISRCGQGRTIRVDQMMVKIPKLFYGLFWYTTKILTCSLNTKSVDRGGSFFSTSKTWPQRFFNFSSKCHFFKRDTLTIKVECIFLCRAFGTAL